MAKKTNLAVAATAEELGDALERPAEPDWAHEVEMSSWWLPYNLGAGVDHAFFIGSSIATGSAISGIVQRITWMPNGTVRVVVKMGTETRYLIVKEGHGEVRS
jgi:hypothetical protein